MNLIDELRAKSANAEEIKLNVIAEIQHFFDSYLNSELFEEYLRHKIGDEEIKKRQVFIGVEFWKYHTGCSCTHFSCGVHRWTNPENEYGYKSHSYKNIELISIQNKICNYIASRLKERMNELGFYQVSERDIKGKLGYYHTLFYFGW